MELLQQILLEILKKEKVEINFPNLNINANELIEIECFKTLQKIKAVIENDSLNDKECFMKIEEIICIFEKLGCNTGNRHEF